MYASVRKVYVVIIYVLLFRDTCFLCWICVYVCVMCVYMCVSVCIHCMWVCACTCVWVCVWVCVCVCVCVCFACDTFSMNCTAISVLLFLYMPLADILASAARYISSAQIIRGIWQLSCHTSSDRHDSTIERHGCEYLHLYCDACIFARGRIERQKRVPARAISLLSSNWPDYVAPSWLRVLFTRPIIHIGEFHVHIWLCCFARARLTYRYALNQ